METWLWLSDGSSASHHYQHVVCCREQVWALTVSVWLRWMTKSCCWRPSRKSYSLQRHRCHSKCRSTESRQPPVLWIDVLAVLLQLAYRYSPTWLGVSEVTTFVVFCARMWFSYVLWYNRAVTFALLAERIDLIYFVDIVEHFRVTCAYGLVNTNLEIYYIII